MTGGTGRERDLLEAARAGDEGAFAALVGPHRPELHAHCYRMLGSLHDAEDALQDTMLRAWRGLPGFAGRRPRPWLYAIATNVCLDACARRRRRILPMDHGPPAAAGQAPGEPLEASAWVEPYPDGEIGLADGLASPEARYEQREALELAFIAALQHLPPRGRAVLILREVLGFSAQETAGALDTTTASVNSALQRARRAIEERLPERSQQETLRALGDDGVRDLVERFIDAFERADVDAIVALLAADAEFAMPPYAAWARGREAVAESWLMPTGPPDSLRYVATRANGQVALGTYALDRARGTYAPIALDVLTLRGREIAVVFAFRSTDAFARFGLPDEVTASHPSPRASR
ncbi:MAG TPA: sigma-70 family RNA polymerase sigma factor [Miltoncostaeaceae bacterium]|nr:sigma-70 family RNA polymerase sigma factor [Miltoncostaeaceae bacterium]